MDEPTNDLDTKTLAILEDYLDSYEGIVITVSHDRYFLDRVVRRIFAFEEGGRICQYEGGYTDYVNRLASEGRLPGDMRQEETGHARADISAGETENTQKSATRTHGKKLRFSYNEQREYETIEDDIAALEDDISALEREMTVNATNSARLCELSAEKEQKERLLEEKMERWEYLEELAQRIEAQD